MSSSSRIGSFAMGVAGLFLVATTLPPLVPTPGVLTTINVAHGHVVVQTPAVPQPQQQQQQHKRKQHHKQQSRRIYNDSQERASLLSFEAELLLLPLEQRTSLDKALIKLPSVAKDPAFRMMFLRKEEHNAAAAANLFAEYWKNRVSLFGEQKAFLPMTQDGAMKDDQEALGYGYMRPVPGHPTVVVMDPSRTPKTYDVDSVVRSVLYVLEKALMQSDEMQRGGATVVMDFGKIRSFDSKLFSKLDKYMNHGFPLRPNMRCVIRAHPVTSWVIGLMSAFSKEKIHVVKNQAELKKMTGADDESVFDADHMEWLESLRQQERN